MTLTSILLSLFISQNPPDLDRVLACHVVQGASMGIGTIIGIDQDTITSVSKQLFDICLQKGPGQPLAHLEKTVNTYHAEQLKKDWCIFSVAQKYKTPLKASDSIPDKARDQIRVCLKSDHH